MLFSKFLFMQPIDLSLVMQHSHVSSHEWFSANQLFVVCQCSPHECCSGLLMSEVGSNGIWRPHYHCYPMGTAVSVSTNWQKAENETHNGGASESSKEEWLLPRVREHRDRKYGLLPMSRIFRWHECFYLHVSPSSHGVRVNDLRPLGSRLTPSEKLVSEGC